MESEADAEAESEAESAAESEALGRALTVARKCWQRFFIWVSCSFVIFYKKSETLGSLLAIIGRGKSLAPEQTSL